MVRNFLHVGICCRALVGGLVLALTVGLAPTVIMAQDIPEALKQLMAKEKEARRACKITICKAFAAPKADGGPIACNVTKTWVATEIQKRFLGNRLSWPWGHAQCVANIEIDSAQVAAVMQTSGATLKLKKHDISCTLHKKDASKGVAYTVKLSIQPEVAFDKGKAVEVKMGWSNIQAPALAKGAIWSATKLDQAFSVMSSGIKKEINDFLYSKCADDGVPITAQK